MDLSLKEQLIWLQLQQVSYRDCWHYLRYALQTKSYTTTLSLSACQELLQEVRQQSGALQADHIGFEAAHGYEGQVRNLAKQALLLGEKAYPALWLEIPKPPLLMYYRGDLSLLSRPLISIVGTRSMTEYGYHDATLLTQTLNRLGLVCVSGMALGVDACVHQTALEQLNGKTVAIVASGLNHCYPKQHLGLYEQLANQQLVLSEYLPNTPVRKHHFIMRNRLVAGIAPALVVIEAAVKSGSLITANYALQYNREVYACPGHLSQRMSAGCNQLLQAGAIPIYHVASFIEEVKELYQVQGFLAKHDGGK